MSRDPVGLLGSNAYVYVGANPLNLTDPLGLFWESAPGWVKTAVTITAGVAVGVAVGALVVAAAPALGVAAGVAGVAALIAGGIAGGAAAGGLDAAMTEGGCVLCGMAKGALIGGIASLPFAFLPATAGYLAFAGVGALSGAIGYGLDLAISGGEFTWTGLGESMLAGAAFGVAAKFVHGLIRGKEVPPEGGAPRRGTPNAETVERTGKPTEVMTNRTSEQPYHHPPERYEIRPGEPVPELDPSKGRYLWQVNEDGTVVIAPENQSGFGVTEQRPTGRPVKHGDLNPGENGMSRGVNRAGGELVPQVDGEGNPTGRWTMNNDSSNSFARSDGTTSTPENLRAAKQLFEEGGMDMSNVDMQTFDGQQVSE